MKARLCVLSVLLCVIALAPRAAQAQTLADYDYENLGFRGIGFDYGYIWPTRVSPTPAYSFRADLGFLGPGVRVAPSLTYWSSHYRRAELDRLATRISNLQALRQQNITITGDQLGDVKWSDLSVAVDVQLLWTTPVGVFTYVGVGGGIHLLNGQGSFIENTFIEDLLDSTSAGVALMGGVEANVAPRLRLYGEARYTLISDLRYPGLRIGGALMLPPRAPGNTTR